MNILLYSGQILEILDYRLKRMKGRLVGLNSCHRKLFLNHLSFIYYVIPLRKISENKMITRNYCATVKD